MKALITGSSGHLGEALARTLAEQGHEVTGLDIIAGACTTHVGSITDRDIVHRAMAGAEVVLHPATLHKPHVVTHSRQDFIDVNISGTLTLLEEAARLDVGAFVYTSTTSVFGDALVPPPGAPAAWITEDVTPVPKNIYGVTKAAAEDLCHLFHRNHGLPCIVLRTSRFFPEPDDSRAVREAWDDANHKVNELLHRRVDIDDVVAAHLRAAERAPVIGFGRYIVSATTPFRPEDAQALREDAPAVVRERVPGYEDVYHRLGWAMASSIDRAYVNTRAREELGWRPRFDFAAAIARLAEGEEPRSELSVRIGARGYHGEEFADGLYPVE